MELKDVIKKTNEKLALVIGNGINRYNGDNEDSWESMLKQLWGKYSIEPLDRIPNDISLTEFYDALDLNNISKNKDLKKSFCDLMKGWKPKQQHYEIVSWARKNSVPILTTNFEETLSSTFNFEIKHFPPKKIKNLQPIIHGVAIFPIQISMNLLMHLLFGI